MWNDDNIWWNKIQNMSEEEMDLIPYGFVKKYGSFLNSIEDLHKLQHDNENKVGGKYSQVKDLQELQTNEEKEELEASLNENIGNDGLNVQFPYE